MKIVTTPMCEEILKMAGITDYIVNKYPDEENADLAFVLSETDTKMKSVKLKLNTFSQIQKSIITVFENVKRYSESNTEFKASETQIKSFNEIIQSDIGYRWFDSPEKEQLRNENRKIKVKVYSNFLKDILNDMGYTIVNKKPDFIVYPDYLENNVGDNLLNGVKSIKIPSHGDVPLNPLERAIIRYNLLEKGLCMRP
ncbi:hypothetical protein [Methanobacterium alcaliphilum]|uniref:hypothetical protein n=1 Tax=Methanobacterium alcaliphilum TaxID=392018 RepID=UPI00200B3569|nr:hypothetical protein [Methanobacterium alcaliphilum]MCK9151522.1 hypothetical protein [Methanobacterium alcaliphilum]